MQVCITTYEAGLLAKTINSVLIVVMAPCIMTCGCIKEAATEYNTYVIRGTLEARQEGTSMATVVFVKAVQTTSQLYHGLLQVCR